MKKRLKQRLVRRLKSRKGKKRGNGIRRAKNGQKSVLLGKSTGRTTNSKRVSHEEAWIIFAIRTR